MAVKGGCARKLRIGREREDGPCNCSCHDAWPRFEVRHVVPCCAYSEMPREQAELATAEARQDLK